MNTNTLDQRKTTWPFLLGMLSLVLGLILSWSQNPDVAFASGFFIGIACPTMGMYIFMAAAQKRGSS